MLRNTRKCWLGRTTSMIPMEKMEMKREYRTSSCTSLLADVDVVCCLYHSVPVCMFIKICSLIRDLH